MENWSNGYKIPSPLKTEYICITWKNYTALKLVTQQNMLISLTKKCCIRSQSKEQMFHLLIQPFMNPLSMVLNILERKMVMLTLV